MENHEELVQTLCQHSWSTDDCGSLSELMEYHDAEVCQDSWSTMRKSVRAHGVP